jgi:hypothetical protein
MKNISDNSVLEHIVLQEPWNGGFDGFDWVSSEDTRNNTPHQPITVPQLGYNPMQNLLIITSGNYTCHDDNGVMDEGFDINANIKRLIIPVNSLTDSIDKKEFGEIIIPAEYVLEKGCIELPFRPSVDAEKRIRDMNYPQRGDSIPLGEFEYKYSLGLLKVNFVHENDMIGIKIGEYLQITRENNSPQFHTLILKRLANPDLISEKDGNLGRDIKNYDNTEIQKRIDKEQMMVWKKVKSEWESLKSGAEVFSPAEEEIIQRLYLKYRSSRSARLLKEMEKEEQRKIIADPFYKEISGRMILQESWNGGFCLGWDGEEYPREQLEFKAYETILNSGCHDEFSDNGYSGGRFYVNKNVETLTIANCNLIDYIHNNQFGEVIIPARYVKESGDGSFDKPEEASTLQCNRDYSSGLVKLVLLPRKDQNVGLIVVEYVANSSEGDTVPIDLSETSIDSFTDRIGKLEYEVCESPGDHVGLIGQIFSSFNNLTETFLTKSKGYSVENKSRNLEEIHEKDAESEDVYVIRKDNVPALIFKDTFKYTQGTDLHGELSFHSHSKLSMELYDPKLIGPFAPLIKMFVENG